MVCTDYRIEALEILLDESCLLQRYYPLIPHKEKLVRFLLDCGCSLKSDAQRLSDETLASSSLGTLENARLFRRFLTLYDPKPTKIREMERLNLENTEKEAYKELYLLPGVKQTRAFLYYKAGFLCLNDFSQATVKEIQQKTRLAIETFNLNCIAPLEKEIRTHIAVAKAFTLQPAKSPMTI